METARSADLRAGIRVELASAAWMTIEMAASLAAGIASGSILLIAFGLDSLIELVGGGILLWRLQVERDGEDLDRVERAEHTAARVVAIGLALLCIYVLMSSVYGLIIGAHPENSAMGIAVAAIAVLAMPYLATVKRRISGRIGSEALAGDAVNSITCAYMAGTVLVGLALDAFLGWWWIQSVAALVFLAWLARETWEALEDAKAG
jgi:divalent metal cation (Fe/Co/Zn/Cd) transporter